MQKMDVAMAQLQMLWRQWRVAFTDIVVGSVGVSVAVGVCATTDE